MDKNQSPLTADVIYRVDADGRLTFVNEGWNDFARLNGAPGLCGPAVLGRCVADFIAGGETRQIYQWLLRRVASGIDLQLPYRCDSPSQRRRMMLAMTRRGGEVEFLSQLVDGQTRPVVPVLDPERPRSSALLTLCSWCNRGRVGNHWAEIEEVVVSLGLFEAEVPRLTHGVCGDCLARLSLETSA